MTELIKATINGFDITDKINLIYLNDNLIKYNEFFNENDINKQLYFEFKTIDGRILWFNTFINDLNQYFYIPRFKNNFEDEFNNKINII